MGPRIAKMILKKMNKIGLLTVSCFKTCHKARFQDSMKLS